MVTLGILGCGHWGPNFVRNFSQMPDVKIAGISDKSIERLNYMQGIYPSIRTCRDYRTLLKNNTVDAIVISTPAATHYQIAREALERGKHVLVEKPISITIREAQGLAALSEKVKRVLMVGHTFLYNPTVRKMKEIVDRRELGRIYYIHSRRTNLGPIRKDVNTIWDLAPHDISIVNYLLEKMPQEVSAHAQRFLYHSLEDVGFIILRYPDGVLVHIHVSWLDPKKIREMTIVGSKKMLVYNDINSNEPLILHDKNVMQKRYEKQYRTFEEFQSIIRNGQSQMPKVQMQEPLRIECQHFIDCILRKRRPLTDGKNGLQVLRVMKAINKSVQSNGRFIRLRA